jgi:protein SCO1/2
MKSSALRNTLVPLVFAALAGSFTLPVAAHDDHSHHGNAAAKPVAPQSTRITLPDTPLVDQNGRNVRFRSDVMGERIVVVGFIYTTCTTVCPVLSSILAQAQSKLGSRVGRDVGLVTVTVDPVRDTPARLKEYSAKMGASPAWSWLTGPKPQVDEVLKVFGAYTPNFLEHPPVVFVGDAKAGKWVRFFGFPNPDQLVAAVNELSAERAKLGAAG